MRLSKTFSIAFRAFRRSRDDASVDGILKVVSGAYLDFVSVIGNSTTFQNGFPISVRPLKALGVTTTLIDLVIKLRATQNFLSVLYVVFLLRRHNTTLEDFNAIAN